MGGAHHRTRPRAIAVNLIRRAAAPPAWLLALVALGVGIMCAPSAASAAQPATARVIGVGGGVTEIVYALGAQDLLIAVDTSSTYPDAARALPKVGYQRTLAAEGVLSLRPSVVLASDEAGPPVVLRQIEDAGVRVVRVDGEPTFEGLLRRVRVVAGALQRTADGERLAQRLTQQWQAVQQRMRQQPARAPGGRRLRVAFLMVHSGVSMAAGRGTGADALLRLAGAENAFANAFDDYKPLSPESLAAAAPDVIIATTERPDATAATLTSMRALPGVPLTPAGEQGRVAVIDIVLALGFGPRLPEAVETLHQALLK